VGQRYASATHSRAGNRKFNDNARIFLCINTTKKQQKEIIFMCAGFGGNVVREEVKSRSEWYVESFQELIDAL